MSISNKIVNNGIDFIITNLNHDLTVETIANYCNYSKFHFNRLFRAETGESVYSFIKRLRMEKSALRLGTDINRTITEISIDYGYSSSNYSSAFKKHHKISPIEFRKLKQENKFDLNHPLFNIELSYKRFIDYDEKISIQNVDDFSVIYERFIGNYKDMSVYWPCFINRNKHLINRQTQFLEISYDDPNITDKNRCIYDICMTVGPDKNYENIKVVKGGKFAVYKYEGSIIEIFQAFKGILNIWMPKSSYEMDDRTGFEVYKKVDSVNNFFEMDLHIPVK